VLTAIPKDVPGLSQIIRKPRSSTFRQQSQIIMNASDGTNTRSPAPSRESSDPASARQQEPTSKQLVLGTGTKAEERFTLTESSHQSFSVDLPSLCLAHLSFLERLHQHGIKHAVGYESLRRYRDLWLPLLAASYEDGTIKPEIFVAPPDVAWLWHVHRLSPFAYERYIEEQFYRGSSGRPNILDLNAPAKPYATFDDQDEAPIAITMRHWQLY